jgi:eukaryotic-like serine/threonine-protein kinase
VSLPHGTRLGAYEIADKIGEGGMGQVYRARDLALRRDVAIKIIAAPLAHDDQAQVRFEREAQLVASLNHPHIAAVYGQVDEGGVRGLVMELIEGPTLAERLASGQLTPRESLAIAGEIAEALEAAHDKGIVHRDLKPANIKLTRAGGVKVLDFGIAKVLSGAGNLANDPTIEATRAGMVVGTAAYMSPEQARGEPVDARTDIWAFGCVLHEMLTGHGAFAGRTQADTLAQVLQSDPDWTRMTAAAPPSVARLIRRCLEKDPARRLRNIADARFEIEDASAAPERLPSAQSSWTRGRVALAATGTAMVAALATYGLGGMATSTRLEGPAPPMTLGMAEPPGETLYRFVDPLKIAPDGKRLAMVTMSPKGKSRLWLRSLDRIEPEPVPEADGAMYPFWSPDSRSLGFCADGQLKIIDLASRSVRVLAPVAVPICGASWNRDGQLVVVTAEGLGLMPASGGELKPLTTVTRSQNELMHGFPEFLPDGRHFMFIVMDAQLRRGRVAIGSIDSSETTPLGEFPTMPVYAEPGYLIFARGSELVAQPFDAVRRVLTGDPVGISASPMIWTSIGVRGLSVSDAGALVFMTRRVVTTQLTWFDRSGRPAGTLAEPGEWVHVAISRDERTVAAERLEARTVVGAIWTIDVARNVMSRFTPDDTWNFAPVWSPDGLRLAFSSTREGLGGIFTKRVDGGGYQSLFASAGVGVPTDWTADRLLLDSNTTNGGSVWSLAPGGDRKATLLVEGGASGVLSQDGRWLAYVSSESGRMEVYVRAVSGGRPYQISRAGGSEPRWRRDGKELFFVSADRKIVAVPVTTGATFNAAEPQTLPIDTQPDVVGNRHTYDVDAVGQRFLVARPTGMDPTPQIAVMLNWQALLRR